MFKTSKAVPFDFHLKSNQITSCNSVTHKYIQLQTISLSSWHSYTYLATTANLRILFIM